MIFMYQNHKYKNHSSLSSSFKIIKNVKNHSVIFGTKSDFTDMMKLLLDPYDCGSLIFIFIYSKYVIAY